MIAKELIIVNMAPLTAFVNKIKKSSQKGYPKNSLKKVASITYHIASRLLEHLLWVAPTTHYIAFITLYHLMWSLLL
jgi:hypothetical protein